MSTRQFRRDTFKAEILKHSDATPNGGVEAFGVLTRCGVFVYPDGNELRHPDEVFSPESLATLRGAPIVVGHPGDITADNWRVHSIGHVGDDVGADRSRVAATQHINDRRAADDVRAGNLVENSCGYSCLVVDEIGEYDGIPYTRKQVAIEYNHVGMGPEGWGRAGSAVRIYADSKGENVELPTFAEGHPYFTDMAEQNRADAPAVSLPVLQALLAAGALAAPVTQVQQPAPPQIPAVDQARFDAMRGENEAMKSQIAQLTAAQTQTQTETQARADADKQAAAIASRVELMSTAERVGVFDGSDVNARAEFSKKNDRDIRVAVIEKLTPGVKTDGETDDYVRACCDTAVRGVQMSQVSEDLDRAANIQRSDGNSGGAIGSKIAAARADSAKKTADAWKQPKSANGVRRAG